VNKHEPGNLAKPGGPVKVGRDRAFRAAEDQRGSDRPNRETGKERKLSVGQKFGDKRGAFDRRPPSRTGRKGEHDTKEE